MDKLSPEEISEFREIFNLVDKDGGGEITKAELGELLDTLGDFYYNNGDRMDGDDNGGGDDDDDIDDDDNDTGDNDTGDNDTGDDDDGIDDEPIFCTEYI